MPWLHGITGVSRKFKNWPRRAAAQQFSWGVRFSCSWYNTHIYMVHGKTWCQKKKKKKPGCPDFKRMENILVNNFILENNFLTRVSLERKSSQEISGTIFFCLFLLFTSPVENTVAGRWHLCSSQMPIWRLKNVPQNPAKGISEKEMLSFPLKFTGHIFSPSHKPFGVIPQAHSLNLWSFFGICAESQLSRSEGLWCEHLPRKGTAVAPEAPICL